VPQVLLTDADQHFLWLSASRPIGATGTPFTPDRQSWMRNAELDPDWLRIGGDIIGGKVFNAAFSPAGLTIPEPASLKHGLQKSAGRQITSFWPRERLRGRPNAPNFPVH